MNYLFAVYYLLIKLFCVCDCYLLCHFSSSFFIIYVTPGTYFFSPIFISLVRNFNLSDNNASAPIQINLWYFSFMFIHKTHRIPIVSCNDRRKNDKNMCTHRIRANGPLPLAKKNFLFCLCSYPIIFFNKNILSWLDTCFQWKNVGNNRNANRMSKCVKKYPLNK